MAFADKTVLGYVKVRTYYLTITPSKLKGGEQLAGPRKRRTFAVSWTPAPLKGIVSFEGVIV